MNRHDLGCLAVAITSYLTSEYFTGLAPGTQRMRRRLLNNVFAEVQRLSAAGQSFVTATQSTSTSKGPVHSGTQKKMRAGGFFGK
jgi:hypothetical protein